MSYLPIASCRKKNTWVHPQFLVLDMRQQWQNRCVGNLPAESSHDKSRRTLFLGFEWSQNLYASTQIYVCVYYMLYTFSIEYYIIIRYDLTNKHKSRYLSSKSMLHHEIVHLARWDFSNHSHLGQCMQAYHLPYAEEHWYEHGIRKRMHLQHLSLNYT